MTEVLARPNLFILGAPKCGTTALSQYLAAHPDILFSQPKEPQYFDTDLTPSAYEDDADYVARCFPNISQYQVAGEGSTWNLYSTEAVSNILRFNLDSKFIVMMRHPADLFYSLYHHHYAAGFEKERNAATVWQRQAGRSRTEVENPRQELCADLYLLGEQLERLYAQVDQTQVLVLFYEDLARDPAAVYAAALKFLGVANDGRTHFPVVNVSRAVRHEWLYCLIRRYRKLKKRLGIRLGLGETRFARWLFGKKPPLDPTLRHEIIAYCHDDIQKISTLTSRDLTHWLR